MNEKIEFIKCKKCGFDKNIKGSKRCIKCKTILQHDTISCPKCARINKNDVIKCVSCGYKFKGKNWRNLINLIISIIVVIILGVLVYVDNNFVVSNLKWIIKIVGLVGIIMILISTLSYGKKQQLVISAEEQINDKKFKRFKVVSSLSVVLGILIVMGIVIFICFA